MGIRLSSGSRPQSPKGPSHCTYSIGLGKRTEYGWSSLLLPNGCVVARRCERDPQHNTPYACLKSHHLGLLPGCPSSGAKERGPPVSSRTRPYFGRREGPASYCFFFLFPGPLPTSSSSNCSAASPRQFNAGITTQRCLVGARIDFAHYANAALRNRPLCTPQEPPSA